MSRKWPNMSGPGFISRTVWSKASMPERSRRRDRNQPDARPQGNPAAQDALFPHHARHHHRRGIGGNDGFAGRGRDPVGAGSGVAARRQHADRAPGSGFRRGRRRRAR